MEVLKTTASILMCVAFIAACSMWLALAGEPINGAIWSDRVWGW